MRNKLKDIGNLEDIFTIKISHNSIKLKYKDKKEEFDYSHIVEKYATNPYSYYKAIEKKLSEYGEDTNIELIKEGVLNSKIDNAVISAMLKFFEDNKIDKNKAYNFIMLCGIKYGLKLKLNINEKINLSYDSYENMEKDILYVLLYMKNDLTFDYINYYASKMSLSTNIKNKIFEFKKEIFLRKNKIKRKLTYCKFYIEDIIDDISRKISMKINRNKGVDEPKRKKENIEERKRFLSRLREKKDETFETKIPLTNFFGEQEEKIFKECIKYIKENNYPFLEDNKWFYKEISNGNLKDKLERLIGQNGLIKNRNFIRSMKIEDFKRILNESNVCKEMSEKDKEIIYYMLQQKLLLDYIERDI